MEDRSGGIARTTAVERTSSTGFDEGEVCELRLLDAVRDGHPEAFGALYERHHDAVFCLARRLTRDKYEADDVVSEVFCNTLRAIRNGGGPRDEAKPYLLRSVRHTVTNMHTRKDTGRATPMANDDLDRADTHDPYPMGGPATDAYLDVSDRFRDVLWATEVDGAGTADVAAAQHISGPAAASLAYRARRALRRSYLRGCIRVPVVSDDCLETRALLPAFVDGDTATPGADRVRKHIATCPTCDGVLVQLNSVHDRLSNRSWFVVSAGALRWLTADGGRTLVGVIGTSPVVIAAGLGVGALVTTVHSDTSPDRTEAARATELVVVPPSPEDVGSGGPADNEPTSVVPNPTSGAGPVVDPIVGPPSAEPVGVPTPAGGTGTSGPAATPGTAPHGTALPAAGQATGQATGGIDSIVTGGGNGPVAGAGPAVGGAVEGITNTVETTTSSMLGVVEGTAGAVVGVPSTALGLVEPVLAAVPAVGQVTAPVGPLVDQLSATELAVVATTVDQLNATTNGALVAINTTTTELTGPLLSHD